VRQDEGVHLGQASALDEVIQTADCGEPWQSLKVIEEVLLLRLKQLPVSGVP